VCRHWYRGQILAISRNGLYPPSSLGSVRNVYATETQIRFGSKSTCIASKPSRQVSLTPAAQTVRSLISSLSSSLAKSLYRYATANRSWGLRVFLLLSLQKLSIYLCYPLDDSYTPATLAVRAGTGTTDLQDCRVLSLDKPDGWFTFDVSAEPNEEGDGA
jgi:hypothetical protein